MASTLHPLETVLPDGELQLVLNNPAWASREVVVECDYRPYRERDVRKERSFHLLDLSPWRIGRDRMTVNQEEVRNVTRSVRAVDATVTLAVSLHDPDPKFRAYQLDRVRVDDVRLGSWFAEAPSLDPGFGLACSTEALSGTVRPGGLAAAPLHGLLPLWPGLRQVTVTFAPVVAPVIRLWDPRIKHHWDGWRQTVPEPWPGGETIVARHVSGTTVWRSHAYFAVPPAGAPAMMQPTPPKDVLPGVGLEVYWTSGDTLQFPEMHFDGTADVIPVRMARLTPRARELLALSVASRPGLELNSLSAEEWNEFAPLIDRSAQAPVTFAWQKGPEGADVMTVHRVALDEPWVYLFGVEYDSGRRVGINVLQFSPDGWSGVLPE